MKAPEYFRGFFIDYMVKSGIFTKITERNKYSSDMETRKKIEEILLNDYGCFDDFTIDKLLDLFSVSGMCSGCDWIDIDYKVRKCVKCGKTEQFD